MLGKLRGLFSKKSKHEEGFDFLDSSARERLLKKCREVFPPDQIEEFSNYTILEELGRGSVGTVYKALHKTENKIYALKSLPQKLLNDPSAADRFFQEIFIHQSLQHENIIQLYNVGVGDDSVFIVMEYILGNDLDMLIRQQGRFDEREAIELTTKILEAVSYAHDKNIVHRDIKPANVMMQEPKRIVKVADFGLAKLSGGVEKDGVFGTPAYMAPEQITSKGAVDIRADLYAVGSILYHLLCGQRPYIEIQDPQLLLKTKQVAPPTEIIQIVPDIHKGLNELVKHTLEINPKKRIESPEDFIQRLLDIQSEIEKLRPEGRRKAPPRPSEKLRADAKLTSTAFAPRELETVPELFMTATCYEVDPATETFAREVADFNKSVIGTLLQEEEEGFEETLLTMTMEPEATVQITSDLEKLLKAQKRRSLLDLVLDNLKSGKLTSSQKSILSELKYVLLLRGNSITKEKSLLEFINEGTKKIEMKLDEMSRVTQSRPFNKRIRQYFQDIINDFLNNYGEIFRTNLSRCKNLDEVTCYLQNYPLYSHSTIKKYKKLEIIKKVKDLAEEISNNKNITNIEKLIDTKIGKSEDKIRKTFMEVYLQKGEDVNFWGIVHRSRDLPTFMKHMMRLNKQSEFKSVTTKVISLIEAFLDSGGRTSLDNLKTGLNFIPQKERDKICQLVSRRLNTELQRKTQEILNSGGDSAKRLRLFLNLLQNPRYHSRTILLFGFPVKVLAAKISKIRSENLKPQNVFQDKEVPGELIGLIANNREMEILAKAKTLQNCLNTLKKLEKTHTGKQKPKEPLLKSLLTIFNTYGKINFAKDNSPSAISGYEISRQIVRFYNDPGRTKIQLPNTIQAEVLRIVKSLIDKERASQMKKMDEDGWEEF